MQLLLFFLKKTELMETLLKTLAQNNLTGGTILDAKGLASGLSQMEDELPMIWSLRKYLEASIKSETKLLIMAIKDEDVIRVADLIKSVVGDLSEPNSGVLLTLPVMYCEGIL